MCPNFVTISPRLLNENVGSTFEPVPRDDRRRRVFFFFVLLIDGFRHGAGAAAAQGALQISKGADRPTVGGGRRRGRRRQQRRRQFPTARRLRLVRLRQPSDVASDAVDSRLPRPVARRDFLLLAQRRRRDHVPCQDRARNGALHRFVSGRCLVFLRRANCSTETDSAVSSIADFWSRHTHTYTHSYPSECGDVHRRRRHALPLSLRRGHQSHLQWTHERVPSWTLRKWKITSWWILLLVGKKKKNWKPITQTSRSIDVCTKLECLTIRLKRINLMLMTSNTSRLTTSPQTRCLFFKSR